MATHIYCKSDCEFSNQIDRICKLEVIEVVQMGSNSPNIACCQYVKRSEPTNRFVETDIDRARAAAVWGLKEMSIKK